MASSNSSSSDDWVKDRDRDEDEHAGHHHERRWNKKTHSSFNIDVGMNNYLQGGKFPDASNQLIQ
ncbi:MAG: hypothetical protein WDN75_19155 [Bacteroidota bacterium]